MAIPLSFTTRIFHHLVFTCLNAAEEKEPYEEMARNDKKRYKLQVNDYKNPQPMMVDSENESDS